MYIYKKEIIAAMEGVEGFEVIKNYDDETDVQGVVLAKWKGFVFFISFNDKLALNVKNESDDDDERIYRAVAYNFEVTFVLSGKDIKCDAVSKYKIANYANMKTDLGAVFVYREDAELFELSVKNQGLRFNSDAHISAAVMKMILTGSIAVQELTEMIKSYSDSPDTFLKNCKGIG
ncbi:TPA: hypothetical protein QIR44_001709 [Klebsiella aerogenes]|nr:hypothetical protein [Klebsiella aerogenes]